MFAAHAAFMTGALAKPDPSTVTATISVDASTYDIAFGTDGTKAYVAGGGASGRISVITAASNTVTSYITSGQYPSTVSVAYDSSSGVDAIWSGNSDGSVTLYKTSSSTASISFGPSGSAAKPGGNAYFSAYEKINIRNLSNSQVTEISPSGFIGRGIAVSPDGSQAYCVDFNGYVKVLSTSSNTITDTITVDYGSFDVIFSPDGAKAYVGVFSTGKVHVINTSTKTVSTSFTVATNARGLGISPDGGKLYIADVAGDAIRVVDTSTNSLIRTISLPSGASPYSVAVSPDGKKVYAANFGNNTVSVIT